MPRLPLALVLARSSLRSSLARGFGCLSCQRPVIVVLLVAGDRGLPARERPRDLGRDRAIWQPRLLVDGVGDLPGPALDHAERGVDDLVVLHMAAPRLRLHPDDHQLTGFERRL